jgi:NTP pyrophosphatase (non-canonical NTP hydrolase)
MGRNPKNRQPNTGTMATSNDHSDATTSLQQLKEMVREFCEAREWDQFHNPKDLAIGIITEAGELLEPFRFKSAVETEALLNDPGAKARIAQEAVDVLYFILRLAQKYNIDLSREFHKKMQINETRYPIVSSKGTNKKYTDLT